ncbi:MAG TPA: energy transducer TonB [Terriglobales bacterium]
MFEDSLVESSGRLAAGHSWTMVISFVVQCMALSLLLLLSLLYTESLPAQRWINTLQSPPPPAAVATVSQRVAPAAARGGDSESVLVVPRQIPTLIATFHDSGPSSDKPMGVAGDFPGSEPDGVLHGTTTPTFRAEANLPKLAVQKIRVSSGVAEGMLIQQVKPQYPAAARLARVEGKVVLQAVIGKDGTIQNLHVMSGHPLLTPAAIEAVRQWRYKPYYLNAEPVEVETQIVLNFLLTHD